MRKLSKELEIKENNNSISEMKTKLGDHGRVNTTEN